MNTSVWFERNARGEIIIGAPVGMEMAEWMANGVDIGWLIDADTKTVYVFLAGNESPEKIEGIERLGGEGPIEGFMLELNDIWEGW